MKYLYCFFLYFCFLSLTKAQEIPNKYVFGVTPFKASNLRESKVKIQAIQSYVQNVFLTDGRFHFTDSSANLKWIEQERELQKTEDFIMGKLTTLDPKGWDGVSYILEGKWDTRENTLELKFVDIKRGKVKGFNKFNLFGTTSKSNEDLLALGVKDLFNPFLPFKMMTKVIKSAFKSNKMSLLDSSRYPSLTISEQENIYIGTQTLIINNIPQPIIWAPKAEDATDSKVKKLLVLGGKNYNWKEGDKFVFEVIKRMEPDDEVEDILWEKVGTGTIYDVENDKVSVFEVDSGGSDIKKYMDLKKKIYVKQVKSEK